MKICEIIMRLEDDLLFGWPLKMEKEGYSIDAQALREAVALLKTHPDNQPNEPLTEDELRGMVGKWVWVQYYGKGPHYEGWAYVYDPLWCKYQGQEVPMNLGGRCIKFYLRPPKDTDE